ncbi:MAG: alkaline phosphatase D family protein [Proteobacteria bacterium]|nr:alkaline phosphatase D family protein [Pseudomonadota bacterium]
MHPTRRTWLGLVGTLGVGAMGACLATAAPDATTNVAAMVLEPTSTSFIVSVWAGAVRSVLIAIHQDGELVQLATLELGAASQTGALEVTGLAPDTRYEIQIAAGTGPDPETLVVRTAPRDDDPRPVTIAIGADLDPDPSFDSPIFDAITRHAPELFISLGDFPYTDDGPPATTPAAYRERHLALRRMPPIGELLATTGIRAIYDDHEFHNDWNATFVAREPDRYAAAMTVWDEFFPMRTAGDVRYRSWRWGANLECFMLDCRRFRGANDAPDGPDKTMLGVAQRRWIEDALRASTATFKLVLTSVPLDFGTGNDHWSAFRHERDALLDALVGISGLVFASGDQHWFAAHRHAHGIREFQIGPLARGLGTPDPAVPGVLFRSTQLNFGLVEVSPTTLSFTGVNATGTHFYNERLSVSELTPRRAPA